MSPGSGANALKGGLPMAAQSSALSRAQKRVHLAVAQVPVDLLAIAGGFWTANALVPKPSHPDFLIALQAAVTLLYGICAAVVRAYSADALLSRSKSVLRALAALALATALFTFLLSMPSLLVWLRLPWQSTYDFPSKSM